MKKFNVYFAAILAAGMMFSSCNQESEVKPQDKDEVPAEVLSKLQNLGFKTGDVAVFDEGYLVEGDIYLTDETINQMTPAEGLAVDEQYSTTNLVTGLPRTITVYMSSSSYSAGMQAGLDEAISRYNAENLGLTFQRTSSSSNADIVFSRLSWWQEWMGVLGSAGFPTANGDPYGEIKMSGVLESSYGLNTDGIATIIAHEMGHCIGFRHTDYFDRSISCGGSADNEGDGGVGADHIPGTPTGADTAGNGSWMLACTDGSNRDFTAADKTALDYLY